MLGLDDIKDPIQPNWFHDCILPHRQVVGYISAKVVGYISVVGSISG